MIKKTRIPATICVCDVCGHKWHSIAKTLPTNCASIGCRSREWNGKKVREVPAKIELPKPVRRKVQDDVF